MKKALKLVHVNKKYKLGNKQNFQALYDINAEFERGELVSIVGESGSGKSTLMNLIGGLDSDFTGDIIAGGENLKKLSEKELDKYRKNKVGFVFQSFNLISHLSILDNVTLALTLSNVSEKEKVERAKKILERVGLSEHLKKKPTQLSGGQKQRVAIARALINDPDIIIADEPTGALDSGTTMQILEILKEIADSGKLVIMVTHSEKVASISSRVVEISDGRIVADKINTNYKKSATIFTEESETASNANITSAEIKEKAKKKKKCKNSKDKQNLSLISAIRLSFHNMWASKTKNFLMAFGVAIGIGSLILMMSFSSGITDYIDDTMRSYSDPTIVTISKTSNSTSATSMFSYNSFSEEEIDELIANINEDLKNKYEDGTLSELFEVTDDNISYGIQMMTMTTGAKVIYNPDGLNVVYYPTGELEEDEILFENSGLDSQSIIYIYTTPPYYTSSNIIEGEMSTSSGGIMFSQAILNLFQDGTIYNEDGSYKQVDITFSYTTSDNSVLNFAFTNQEVTAIVDTSLMSNFMVMYIDYDYFQYLFAEQNDGKTLSPNVLYVQTDSEEITNAINAYLATTEGYTGSIEEQLANMFTSMSSVIGTSLSVISSISLVVSAVMILVVMYMSVTERTKEIGVLKSIGARRKDIKRIFTSESFLVGVLSGLVGIIFSLILTVIVYFVLVSAIGIAPISYRWWYFVLAVVVSVLISMVAGLYPASKAAKLDPVESLRRE